MAVLRDTRVSALSSVIIIGCHTQCDPSCRGDSMRGQFFGGKARAAGSDCKSLTARVRVSLPPLRVSEEIAYPTCLLSIEFRVRVPGDPPAVRMGSHRPGSYARPYDPHRLPMSHRLTGVSARLSTGSRGVRFPYVARKPSDAGANPARRAISAGGVSNMTWPYGAFVHRLGRHVLNVEKRDRHPHALLSRATVSSRPWRQSHS